MSLAAAIKLVKSLSSPEKRYFKLHTRQQQGEKEYQDLFDIIDSSSFAGTAAVKEKFAEMHPGSSLDNVSRYLVKLLTDCLIQTRMEKDTFFQLLQGIMRTRVLQERSLDQEGYEQLKKVRRLATDSQQHLVEYMTYRDELNYFSDLNFRGLSDKTLIETQMKAKDILKSMNHIQDHHSLFETLKYRLVHSGKISSEEDKKRLNDLMLSEMILLSSKSKSSFAAQKLHLLFQSFFFIDIGDYQSALKTFFALNKLFELNLGLLDTPPLDYLSALNGIVDSLHMLQRFADIDFYSEKIQKLDQPAYPEYFRFMVRKTLAINQFHILNGTNRTADILDFVKSLDPSLLHSYRMVDEEKQWELYFYCSLAYFKNRDWKKAHAFIDEMINNHKPLVHSLVYKATRLLNIFVYFEKGDLGYLEYEMRSYKRLFSKQARLLECEKMVLKLIQVRSSGKTKILPDLERKKITTQLAVIHADKYEKQLLKYFDFTEWLSAEFGIQV